MLRKIIRPTNVNYNIRIPREYLNQEVEILVFPLTQVRNDTIHDGDVTLLSNHSAGTIEEWRDSSEDEIWI
jgi:hypothetical protein